MKLLEYFVLGVVSLIIYFIGTTIHGSYQKLDPREPPIVGSWIPYIGHLLGMGIYGGRYIKNLAIRLRDKRIFTLPVLNSRMYIVTDPQLASTVQRTTKTLSFTPIIPEVTRRILGLNRETYEIASMHLDPGPGEKRGFLADIQDMVRKQLGPGKYLDELSLSIAVNLQSRIEECMNYQGRDHTKVVDLLSVLQEVVTLATGNCLYGSNNPIQRSRSLIQDFWNFDHGLGALMVNVVPWVTTPKAYTGRERLVRAFADFIEKGENRSEWSEIVQRRVQIALEHGWKLREISRSELSFLFAGIVNTTTSTFWIVLHIFSSQRLLGLVRAEVSSVLQYTGRTTDDAKKVVLNIDNLTSEERCPVLNAVYRECLRLNSDNNSVRFVKEPTILDGYFLAKGAVVQIAGGAMHADPQQWGPDVDKFNPERFRDKTVKPHGAANRTFGGGKTICPGRFLAINEILTLVAIMILEYDMEPPEGCTKIDVPPKNDEILPVHILEPVRPVKVKIRPRAGWQSKELIIKLQKNELGS